VKLSLLTITIRGLRISLLDVGSAPRGGSVRAIGFQRPTQRTRKSLMNRLEDAVLDHLEDQES